MGLGAETEFASPKAFYVSVWRTLQSIDYEKWHSGHGPWTRPNDNTDDEYGPSSTFVGTPADVFHVAFKIFEELVQRLIRDEPVPDHEATLLSVLAICLGQAFKADSANCQNLMETLASASRLRKPQLTRFARCRPLTLWQPDGEPLLGQPSNAHTNTGQCP